MLQQHALEESVDAVETLPPPAGESDLYSAPTRLNTVPLHAIMKMMSDAPSSPNDAVGESALLDPSIFAEVVDIDVDLEPALGFVNMSTHRTSATQSAAPSGATPLLHAALFGASLLTLGASILLALGLLG